MPDDDASLTRETAFWSSSAVPEILIREAADADMGAIQQIYAHHVRFGTASFEEAVPDTAELTTRRAGVLGQGLPYLVAEGEGRILGYAYASAYRARSAYRFSIEDSIYVAEGLAGRGLGTRLMSSLIARCETGPWRQMIAVIGDSDNAASIALHRAFGFRHTGTLRSIGFKFGRWLDSVLMQRDLGAGDASLPVEPVTARLQAKI
jgi:phosphinothricin acetyltransferase